MVGRSRQCGFSTRYSRTFLGAAVEEQFAILADPAFLKVSRRHVRITFLSADTVEVWDLSRNGTFVDGRRVDRIFVDPGKAGAVEIRLAGAETFRLSPHPGA